MKKSGLDAPTKWGEREVRRLLRALRRPHALAMEPLARFLCETYALERPYDAALRFIRDTFVEGGLVGKRLFDLIRTCDIEANETLEGAASEMGVSPRQFFRYRREAILALVAQANRLGDANPAAAGPVEALAQLLTETDPEAANRVYELAGSPRERVTLERADALLNAGAFFDNGVLDEFRGVERLRVLLRVARACYLHGNSRAGDAMLDAVAAETADAIVEDREILEFEMVHVQYVRAVHREAVARSVALGREARRAAQGDEMRTIAAILIEVESATRAGDLAFAEQTLTAAEAMILRRKQVRLVSITICARAAIAFMQGDLQRAYGYIHSARLGLPDRAFDAMMINAHLGRVTLAMGQPWRAPRELLEITRPPVSTLAPSPGSAPAALDGSTNRLFARLYLLAIDLRAAFAAGELESPDELHETLALARQAGYSGIEAACRALLSAWNDRAGRADDAQIDAVAAWEIAAGLGDFFLAHDLFATSARGVREFGAVALDRGFLWSWYRSLGARHPDAALLLGERDAMLDGFWRNALLGARDGADPAQLAAHPFVSRVAEAIGSGDAQRHRTAFVQGAARDAAILLPAGERAAFVANFTAALERCFERLPGAVSRPKRPQF